MSEIISVPNLPREDNNEAIDPIMSSLVRKFGVVVELLDDPDSDGNCQIRLYAENDQVLNEAKSAVLSRNEPE
jgi:hypothetical protein